MVSKPREIGKLHTGDFSRDQTLKLATNHREMHVFKDPFNRASCEVRHTSEEVIAKNFHSKITVERRLDKRKPSNN